MFQKAKPLSSYPDSLPPSLPLSHLKSISVDFFFMQYYWQFDFLEIFKNSLWYSIIKKPIDLQKRISIQTDTLQKTQAVLLLWGTHSPHNELICFMRWIVAFWLACCLLMQVSVNLAALMSMLIYLLKNIAAIIHENAIQKLDIIAVQSRTRL